MHGRSASRRDVFPLVLVLVIVALSALAAACGAAGGGGDGAATATPKQGGTYNYPLASYPDFSPTATQYGDGGLAVLHEVNEGLARWEEQPDGTMKTVPCLAESWDANADATVWTVRLRQGVRFQAPVSREVTAADVVADLRYVADPANLAEIASYYLISVKGTDDGGYSRGGRLGVEALDRYTVRFTLKYPFSEFADTLAAQAFWVWPTDYLRKVGLKAYARHPVGTGPYQFLRQVDGRSVDLVRNPEWWDTSGGPYLDTIHYEVFNSMPSMMLAFQKGTIDWTPVPQGQAATSRSLPQVKSGEWKAESTASLGLAYLCFNMNDRMVGGTQGLALRQALSYGCDRQAVSEASSGGVYLVPTTGVVPPGVPGASDVQEPYAYDPAKAKELMKGIGPVTLRLAYWIGQEREGMVASLTESYARIGITIKAKGMELDAHIANVLAGRTQLYLGGWLADYPSMDNFLYALFESDSSPTSLGTCYSNGEVDALLEEARATPDEEARLEKYAEAERLILADAPVVPLSVYADAKLINGRVANARFNSMFCADLWRAWMK
jgi:ABC-type transport system substrate-binding protein